jgi:minor extracellular serine protease Vpr
MRIFILLLVASFYLPLSAQYKTSAYTMGVKQVIQKELKKNNGVLSENIQKRFPITTINGQYFISLLAKINTSFKKTEIQRLGGFNATIIGNIATIELPLNLFLNAIPISGIDYLEVPEKSDPCLDLAISDTRADSVHMGINLPQSYTGKDVIIGIVDWGFEYSNPVFFDTTLSTLRVLGAWDQVRTSGNPPVGFNHGTLLDNTADLLNMEVDTFSTSSEYHGTHVAGIAGGAGAGTAYRGVGFESDLLFSQMKSGYANSSLDAYQWMYEKATSVGKRLVINNSFGSLRTNPLDGTSLFSQAIDNFIDSGVVFVVSGGNSSGVKHHIKRDFNNDSIKTRIGGFNYANDALLWGQTISTWGEQEKNYSCRIRVLSGSGVLLNQTSLFNTLSSAAFIDSFMVAGIDTVFYMITTDAAHPLNNRPQMTLDIKCTNIALRVVLYSEATTGRVHYWNMRRTIYGSGNWSSAFTTLGSAYTIGDDQYGILHPGVTTGVITVAAHNTFGNVASFSSNGPRMDEFPKPDISAPGVNIASALNSFSNTSFTPVTSVNFNNQNYDFVRLSGTSMSGPMVAGIVSLILEAKPTISAGEVKNVLKNTAYEDSYTGNIDPPGHARWGMGKVDAYSAVNASYTANVTENEAKPNWKIFPNPSSDFIYIEGELTGSEIIRIYAINGTEMCCLRVENFLDISKLASGFYILKIAAEGKEWLYKIIKN